MYHTQIHPQQGRGGDGRVWAARGLGHGSKIPPAGGRGGGGGGRWGDDDVMAEGGGRGM